MSRGTHSNSNRIFMSVSFGKFRQKQLENGEKVTKDTSVATLRTTKSGNDSWAIEYDFITGIIENIYYKEDKDYGNSFEVQISDGPEEYQISFNEESRFWFDLMKKLPNINLEDKVKITVYDFIDNEDKRKVGTSIEQSGEKIRSYFTDYTNDKFIYRYGYPSPEGVNFKDKDEIIAYNIKVKKYLREVFFKFAEKHFKNKPADNFEQEQKPPFPEDEENSEDDVDDLPF